MPGQNDSSFPVTAVPSSSRLSQAADKDSSASDHNASHHSRPAFSPNPPTQHDSTGIHDDSSHPPTKSSKAKASETLRRSQACLACRKRKLRCDAKKPTCTRCENVWLAYQPSTDEASSSSAPPCEYDTSILAKIFKIGSPGDAPRLATSPSTSVIRYRDTIEESQEEQLWRENESLRAQIVQLQQQLRHGGNIPDSGLDVVSSAVHQTVQQLAASVTVHATRSGSELMGDMQCDVRKRQKLSLDDAIGAEERYNSCNRSVQEPVPAQKSRDTSSSPPLQRLEENGTERQPHHHASTMIPSVLSWRASVTNPKPAAIDPSAPPHYSHNNSTNSARSFSASKGASSPLLPSRQVLKRILQSCCHRSWLFSAVNINALNDVATLLQSTPFAADDHLIAQALMLACVATALPLLSTTMSTDISYPLVYKSIDALLRAHGHPTLPSRESRGWLLMVVTIYADGARDLLNQVTARSGGFVSLATFAVRLLLVEISYAYSTASSAQEGLALAVSDARLLHLHSSVTGCHPRFSTGVARSSQLARSLRGLMQSREQAFAFWSLFVHDCFQNRLALLPVFLERQAIQTGLPRQADSRGASSLKRNLDQMEAYVERPRGPPLLEPSDTSMCLLVKVSLVLDQCCKYNVATREHVRSSEAARKKNVGFRQEDETAFLAARESIRQSRRMLSQYDDRTISQSDAFAGSSGGGDLGRTRDIEMTMLLMQDRLRFAAEAVHHLAVLGLYETKIEIVHLFERGGGEARSMIGNAAIWLARLADMALQDACLLHSLPSFCSVAFFVAARWLLYLQFADQDELHIDFSTIVLALCRRGECYSRDGKYDLIFVASTQETIQLVLTDDSSTLRSLCIVSRPLSLGDTAVYAKAIAALKSECEVFGRICISPFTWPIEAISEFVVLPKLNPGGGKSALGAPVVEPGLVSIATLAASIDAADVLALANGCR